MAEYNIFGSADLVGYTDDISDTTPLLVGTVFYVRGGVAGWTCPGVRMWIGPSQISNALDLSGVYAYLFEASGTVSSGSAPYDWVPKAVKAFPSSLTQGWNEARFDTAVDLSQLPGGKMYVAAVYLPKSGFSFKHNVFTAPNGDGDGNIISSNTNLVGPSSSDAQGNGGIWGNGVFYEGIIADPANPPTLSGGTAGWSGSGGSTSWGSTLQTHYGVDVLVTDPTDAPPADTPPTNTAAPSIIGTPTTGSTLTCSDGSWTGTATITYAKQWKRDGVAISGQTSGTYVLQVADEGHAITCTVTASNSVGSASATSNSVTASAQPPTPLSSGDRLAIAIGGQWHGLKLAANVDKNEFAADDYVDSSGDDAPALSQCVADAVRYAIDTERFHARVSLSARKYTLTSAAVKTGPCYAQIAIPPVPETDMKIALDFIGGSEDAGTWNHWNQTVAQHAGCVIESTLDAGSIPDATYGPPSIVGGPQADSLFATAGMPSGYSNMLVTWKGIMVTAPFDAGTLGLNLRNVAMASIENFGYHAQATRSFLANNAPTNDQTVALLVPLVNNNDYVRVGSVGVQGAYTGMNLCDHLAMSRGGFIFCKTALYLPGIGGGHYHGASILNLSVEAGETVLDASMANAGGRFPLFVGMLNCELQSGIDFIDPNNILRGQIYWTEDADKAPTKTGATGITITDLYAA